MTELLRRFPDLGELSVLDLGGVPGFWLAAPVQPRHLTCVNLDPRILVPSDDGGLDPSLPWVDCLHGDACAIDGPVADLVVSNSLIEHVGGVAARQRLADTIRRLGQRYWVQTPYRYFPIEPHWMFPGMQFLPLRARQLVARRHWSVGTRYTPDHAAHEALWTELLGVTEMRHLFPEAEIWRERLAGITKSIVAVRS
jgi:hypothetical protein